MQRSSNILAAKVFTILSVIPAGIWAFSSSPPTRHTGAPGDSGTCAECHGGGPGGGSVAITYSGGTSYTPGERGTFTVTITQSGAARWGFQASARLASNAASGQAGTLIAGANERVQSDGGVQFISHNPAQTGASPFVYRFEWTPPAAGSGDVQVFVAANAANGNGNPSGDSIYTANIRLTENAAQPAPNRPTITEGGVTDAFNFQRGVASGTWVTIFGQNLSSTTRNWDGSPEFAQDKLPMSLDGVSVTINGKPAPVYFIGPTQVNVLTPTDDATGNVQVVIKNANGESTPMTVQKSALLPALYAPFSQNNRLFVTGVENTSGAILGKSGVEPRATRAFRPGDVVQFYATGLGATNPAIPTDQVVKTPATLTQNVTMRINDVNVEVLGAALVGSGLYQINARIPDVPNGDQPIIIEIGGVRSSNTVSIPIQR